MEVEPKRSRWRKKRWTAAAGLFLLPVAYPASLAPVMYGIGRGWVGETAIESAYGPLMEAMEVVTDEAQSSVGVAEFVSQDGRLVTARSRPEVPFWAPPAASLVESYWELVCRCAEVGERHRG